MSILDWPGHLRAAGVKVQEHNSWRTNRPLGSLPDRPKIVWHHDASPVGPSPGALDWIISSYNSKQASAQIWVGYDGTWHFVGSGVAWHTGDVLPGMPGNYEAVGVETDETTGETWSKALLGSLRIGTAAIARAEGYDPETWLHFHKTICRPKGRKSDPEGLDLASERRTVRELMQRPNDTPFIDRPDITKPGTPAAPGGADPEEDGTMLARRDAQSGIDYVYDARNFIQIKDKTHWDLLKGAGFIAGEHGSAASANTWDIEWIRGQVLAWGGHADEYIKPGN